MVDLEIHGHCTQRRWDTFYIIPRSVPAGEIMGQFFTRFDQATPANPNAAIYRARSLNHFPNRRQEKNE